MALHTDATPFSDLLAKCFFVYSFLFVPASQASLSLSILFVCHRMSYFYVINFIGSRSETLTLPPKISKYWIIKMMRIEDASHPILQVPTLGRYEESVFFCFPCTTSKWSYGSTRVCLLILDAIAIPRYVDTLI